jgi:hypothetical protein
MSSSPAPQTQTTQALLSPEQRDILGLAMPSLQQFAGTQAKDVIPPFSGVAPFDPAQTAGQNQVLGAVPQQQAVAGSAASGNQFLTSGDVLDVNRNPGLQGAVDAATRPIWQGLTEQALPNIRSGARAADQFGSSRQGIAEGIAERGALTAAGDTAAKVINPAYQAGLDAMVKGIATAPGTTQNLATPGVTTSGVGDVRQNLAQQMLGEQTQRYGTESMWPLLLGKEYAGIAGTLPGGGATSTASGPQGHSLMQALGLGAAGVGAAGSAMSGMSALLPLLAMSDRRTKRVIERLSETFRGIPLYLFEYIGSSLPQVGVMADEVPAYARVRMNGIDFVDYGAL